MATIDGILGLQARWHSSVHGELTAILSVRPGLYVLPVRLCAMMSLREATHADVIACTLRIVPRARVCNVRSSLIHVHVAISGAVEYGAALLSKLTRLTFVRRGFLTSCFLYEAHARCSTEAGPPWPLVGAIPTFAAIPANREWGHLVINYMDLCGLKHCI